MTNTKKISELTALEQVTEQTYLLVEQDGVACRLPVSVLGEYLGTTSGGEFTFNIYYGDISDIVGTYTAVEGMNWAQWVESDYNTDGFYVNAQDEDHPWRVFAPAGLRGYDCEIYRDETVSNDGYFDMSVAVEPSDTISPDLYYAYK